MSKEGAKYKQTLVGERRSIPADRSHEDKR